MHGSIDKEYVWKLIKDIEEAMSVILEDTSKPFDSITRAERHEVRYYVIVLVEALVALCYHIARRRFGIKPETPFMTLNVLLEKGLLTSEEFNDLVLLVKLRNLLVHGYWVIDDKRIYEAIRNNFRNVRSFLERIKRAIDAQIL